MSLPSLQRLLGMVRDHAQQPQQGQQVAADGTAVLQQGQQQVPAAATAAATVPEAADGAAAQPAPSKEECVDVLTEHWATPLGGGLHQPAGCRGGGSAAHQPGCAYCPGVPAQR